MKPISQIMPNGREYVYSPNGKKLLQQILRDEKGNIIEKTLYYKNKERTLKFELVGDKFKKMSSSEDFYIHTENRDDRTPWIIKSIIKNFMPKGKGKTVTTTIYSPPMYQLGEGQSTVEVFNNRVKK